MKKFDFMIERSPRGVVMFLTEKQDTIRVVAITFDCNSFTYFIFFEVLKP